MSKPNTLYTRLRTFIAGTDQLGIPSLGFRIVAPVERAQARRQQRKYCGTYIAVTGSVGKSTTCYLTAELLGMSGSAMLGVLANTERAILRRLRRLDSSVDYFVQEVSGNAPGIISRITGAVDIDVAVITRVGLDHLTNFITPEAVALEKGRLAESVGVGGIVCLNADDPLVRAMASRTEARIVLFGRAGDAEVRADNVVANWPRGLCFDLFIGERRIPVTTRFPGTLSVTSILGALSVVHALGADLDRAVARLAELEPLGRRLNILQDPGGHTYVLDTAKASHWSTILLVEDLSNWGDMRRVLVLGDMSDIRNDPSRKYRQVLRTATGKCGFVIAIGSAASPAERLLRSDKPPNLATAHDFASARSLLASQPPSLVILKSNTSLSLEDLLPETVTRQAPLEVKRRIGP